MNDKYYKILINIVSWFFDTCGYIVTTITI